MSSHVKVKSCQCNVISMSSHVNVKSCQCQVMSMSSHVSVKSRQCQVMSMSSHVNAPSVTNNLYSVHYNYNRTLSTPPICDDSQQSWAHATTVATIRTVASYNSARHGEHLSYSSLSQRTCWGVVACRALLTIVASPALPHRLPLVVDKSELLMFWSVP